MPLATAQGTPPHRDTGDAATCWLHCAPSLMASSEVSRSRSRSGGNPGPPAAGGETGMGIGVGGALSAMLHALLGKLRKLPPSAESAVRHDVAFLQAELSRMLAAIRRCESSSLDGEQHTRAWMSRVRELAYDIDEWADGRFVATRGAGRGRSSSSSRSRSRSNPSSSTGLISISIRGWRICRGVDNKSAVLPERRHVAAAAAGELQRLKERVLELSERRERYSLAALPFFPVPAAGAIAAARPVDARLAALLVDAWSLVGLDKPVKDVSRMVVTEVGDMLDDVKVVSIVGMAGSGKTTLAAAVYRELQQHNWLVPSERQDLFVSYFPPKKQHSRWWWWWFFFSEKKQQKCFDCHCFVSVGQQQGALNKTLQNMLSQLGNPVPGGEDDDDIGQLISRLTDTLQNKRYLIVVDDIRSREQWVSISHCFPKNKCGSRIITTARDDELTKDSPVGPRDSVYKIGLLSGEDSKKLFLKNVFGPGHDYYPRHLKDRCAEILERCGGLPLALVSVAPILRHRQTKHEWRKLALELLWTSRLALEPVLSRCLNDLAPHLRTCMLYLGIFPECCEVEVERLVRRWDAEGLFIDEGSGSAREETARGWLDELIIRNMVQPSGVKNHDGLPRPRYCKIHPVIHDFIVCKSMEENFVTINLVVDVKKDDAQAQHNQYVPSNNSTVRRLSVRSSSSSRAMMPNESTPDLSHARSITVFGHATATPELTAMKVVRVLDLEGCLGSVSLDPDGLSKLLHLRYLSLRGTDISELPETIGDLRCLETLDVRSTKVEKLPTSIVRLEKLKHLLSGSAKLPSGIMAKMKALQTLSCSIVTQSGTNIIQEISRHDELRELELFAYDVVTQMPEAENRDIIFPHDGFQTLKELRIHCSLARVVTFDPNVLPMVEVLELMFEGGRADESIAVSGIENLLGKLKYVSIIFSEDDKGVMATVKAVRKAAGFKPFISVAGKIYY